MIFCDGERTYIKSCMSDTVILPVEREKKFSEIRFFFV